MLYVCFVFVSFKNNSLIISSAERKQKTNKRPCKYSKILTSTKSKEQRKSCCIPWVDHALRSLTKWSRIYKRLFIYFTFPSQYIILYSLTSFHFISFYFTFLCISFYFISYHIVLFYCILHLFYCKLFHFISF